MATTKINAPSGFRLTQDENDDIPSITLQVVLDPETGTYRTVEASVGTLFEHLTAGAIRSVRYGEAKRLMLRKALLDANPDNVAADANAKAFLNGKVGRKPAAGKLEKPDEALLKKISTVLALAYLTGDFAIKSVERAFGIEYEQAKTLVKLARNYKKDA